MNACHLLLERPWVFDRCGKYDEYLNTYSFTKDGHKIILVPLNSEEIAKNLKLNDDSFLTKLQITGPINRENPLNVGPIKKEYEVDLQVEDLPPKFDDDSLEHPICEINFSPNRDAQYNISLIVDSILSNEATYCINLKVHEILQTQREGLLKKESIMEGLSLYFVPIFFLPPKDEYFQEYVGTGDLKTNSINGYDLVNMRALLLMNFHKDILRLPR
ncbi:uncharacterized protein LOC142165146 [Nicotiana tabacum]|uniref:Uncharacterized protein LOC142165146 n=1 Tax=Nicotiana tabacum TaxID=4097 RepID=A0AC58S4F3_TOBAC